MKVVDVSGDVVTSVEQERDITVQTGTGREALSLPASLQVTTRGGAKLDVPVTWTDCGYDGNVEGNYRFVGTLQMPEGVSNAGMVSAVLTVRVRDRVTPKTTSWTFDTMDDLRDFEAFWVEDAAEGGSVSCDFPQWYVEDGVLRMDRNRTSNGSEKNNLYILTYTGQTYTNFEAEVDFSQEWVREMILFGSQEPGQYINYAEPHSEDNPIGVFIEYEGRRNASGNVVNTNFYARTEENVPFLHEDVAENPEYFDPDNLESTRGEIHTMRVRVVGDTISIYLDDQEEVFTGKLGEGYEGGYISLVSTARDVKFDNFRITELDEEGNPVLDNLEPAAGGELDLTYEAAERPAAEEETQPEEEETAAPSEKTEIPAPAVAAVMIALLVLVLAALQAARVLKKRRGAGTDESEADKT